MDNFYKNIITTGRCEIIEVFLDTPPPAPPLKIWTDCNFAFFYFKVIEQSNPPLSYFTSLKI